MTRSLCSPQKLKHEQHWRDSCCIAFAWEDEVPFVGPLAESCDDLSKGRFRIVGQNEWTGDSFDSSDCIAIPSRGLGITTVCGRPGPTEMHARLVAGCCRCALKGSYRRVVHASLQATFPVEISRPAVSQQSIKYSE